MMVLSLGWQIGPDCKVILEHYQPGQYNNKEGSIHDHSLRAKLNEGHCRKEISQIISHNYGREPGDSSETRTFISTIIRQDELRERLLGATAPADGFSAPKSLKKH